MMINVSLFNKTNIIHNPYDNFCSTKIKHIMDYVKYMCYSILYKHGDRLRVMFEGW